MKPFDERVWPPASAREVFASIDWSRTTLGPIEGWPHQLRTMVEIVLANGRVEMLSAPDLPIGLRDNATAEPALVRLDEGSTVVLYTDGLTEATRDPLEGERLLRAALSNAAFADHPRKATFLYENVLTRRAKDDVALPVIELRKNSVP